MNVEMINASEKSNAMNRIKYSTPTSENARIADQLAGYSLDITGKVMENAAYGKGDLLSKDEISMKAGLVDVSVQRNYMAVMSNSMSEEDFSELLKEGCNPTHTEVKESVTNLDKIKAKMAESGNIIKGFNDDLSKEDLENALGSVAAAAGTIETVLNQNDLPATSENVEGILEAVNLAGNMAPLSDDNIAYMLNNEMEPTISNIYIAEHSSFADTFSKMGNVVITAGNAYASSAQTEAAWDNIKPQAAKIIEEAGLEVNEENLNNAKWLVENQIPLSGESLKAYADIKEISLPAPADEVILSAMNAIEEGKSPKDANLLETKNIYAKAVDIINEFKNADDFGDITRRRQLEEIRLAMTVEANITLLRKGISIDTQNLENLVEQLKSAEKEFYQPILENDSVDIYKQTEAAVEYLKNSPLQSVGDLIESKAEFNITNLKSTAEGLARDYEKAGRDYEKLMTAPRADMGDSMTKAFRNVDDILKDLDLALSEENRRAVRIMGYSQIQISREAVEEIRTAANTVSSVIEMMTPAKTLQMIREGHNPLTENLFELEKELKKSTPEESTEKYSEFLVKLERHGEITEDEKSAYIGMYRLFDKIEKKDSRVIGKVLSAGEDLTFKNLLTAYRSGKFGSLDINIDDEFGLLNELNLKGESITAQIEKGFVSIKAEDTPKEYISDKISMINEAANMDAAAELLEEIDVPVNVENILAANDFAAAGKKTFDKITSNKEETEKSKVARDAIRDKAEKLVDDFDDSASADKAYADFAKEASEIASELMNEADSYIDVKEWSRLHKQITVAGAIAKKSDEYEVPVNTEEGFISVRLKIKQSENETGKVEASFELERYGQVRAMFSVNGDAVSGIVSAKYSGGFDIVRSCEGNFRESLEKQNMTLSDVSYVKVSGNNEIGIESGKNATNAKLFKVAKAFLKAINKGVTEYEG